MSNKQDIKAFIKRWKAVEGNGDREARSFILEFVQDVAGIQNATHVMLNDFLVSGSRSTRVRQSWLDGQL